MSRSTQISPHPLTENTGIRLVGYYLKEIKNAEHLQNI